MSPEVLRRMVEHDGDFGTSAWVLCEAGAICATLHKSALGYFAIPAGTRNMVDPQSNRHAHLECCEALRKAHTHGR